ncbi:retrotransposon protein, putative, ty1-copia subclass [Tanacetum coccineum]
MNSWLIATLQCGGFNSLSKRSRAMSFIRSLYWTGIMRPHWIGNKKKKLGKKLVLARHFPLALEEVRHAVDRKDEYPQRHVARDSLEMSLGIVVNVVVYVPDLQTTLAKSFWDYALETAARILNLVPTKKVEKTPYEVWHGQTHKLSYLKVWGCEALVKRDTLTKPDKLEPRSIKCIFIEYPKETMGYSFYYPPENKVLVARNAEFLENSLIIQETKDDLEIDEPQSDIIPIRRSTRTRHALNRMCLYIDAEEHELGDLGEPANYKAALLDHEYDKWLNAMNVKMQSMKDNEV